MSTTMTPRLREMQRRAESRAQAQPVGDAPQKHPRPPADRIVERRADEVTDRVSYEERGREFQRGARSPEPERQHAAHQERAGERAHPLARGAAQDEVSAHPPGGVREEGEPEE